MSILYNIKAQYNYYPFGKQWEDVNLMANTNRYTFSGKEKQTVRDLGWLDFMARMYSNSEIPIFTTQDPLSEKYYSVSPYAYCGNNPVNRIDPFGMEWLNKRDEEYAKQLIEAANKEIAAKQKSIDKLNAKIEKDKGKGKDVSTHQTTIDNLSTDIDNLTASINELSQMGETKEQKFTYLEDSGNTGKAIKRNDGVIEMTIAGSGNMANGIHESKHGYDLWKNTETTVSNNIESEIRAYGRQFSFDNKSMPSSYWGKINSLQDITRNWVYGIYSTDKGKKEYIYIQQGKVKVSNKDIEAWLNSLRKK
jgi:RHS repeat-associated protein